MENNNKMRGLYELYLELGHEVFEEKIKKPMELYYLQNTHDSSNDISMSSLNTFDVNDMQSHKLGDATFYEEDLVIPPSFDEEIYFEGTLPPIHDDYCDDTYAIKNKFLQVDHDKNDSYDSYFVEFVHDPTEIFYEKGTYAYRYFNNIKFPLFMLKVLKLHLFCLRMLIALCFN